MLTTFVIGAVGYAAVIAINLSLFYWFRRRRPIYLLIAVAFALVFLPLAIVAAIQAFQGLSSDQARGYQLSLIVLVLALPPYLFLRRRVDRSPHTRGSARPGESR